MNYSEQIHDYLDGILDHTEEADLLRAIAQNAELRDELRHAIALKAAFNADVQVLTPPPHLTGSIFANLGFSAQSASPQTILQAQPLLSEAAKSSSGNTALASVVSSVLTAILLLSWNLLGTSESKKYRDFVNAVVRQNAPNALPFTYLRIAGTPEATFRAQALREQVQMLQGAMPQTPMEQMLRYSSITSMFALSQYPSALDISSEVSSEVSSKVSSAFLTEKEESNTFSQEIPHEQAAITNSPFRLNAPSELVSMPSHSVSLPENVAPNEETSWLQRVQIHARRIVSTSLPPTDFPSNPSSFLRNTALGAMVKLSERHSIGVEFSEETYFQNFQDRSLETGTIRNIQQNPSLSWAGISYRYKLLENPVYGFNPFLQGLIGGTQLGATGRMMLGLNYSPDAKTEFTLGVETSALMFLHQGVLYAAPKLGFSYGVSLRF